MQKFEYEQLKENLYIDSLENGLTVYILPKKGFSKTYATFTTKYGSIDNHFQLEGGEEIKVPDGIAHFLEHKMFEKEDGDVFNRFAELGASANAFTSFTRTAYLFSATDRIEESLVTLLDFVQQPYFTEQSVNKEKGIIGQEIRMYEDNPDWRLFFGLIKGLYQRNPVQVDIAGTVESIDQITKDSLYTCYNVFYHPSNMVLFVVGNVDPEAIKKIVRENQTRKAFERQKPITRFFTDEPEAVSNYWNEIKLSVGTPKCLIGFKDSKIGLRGEELLRTELTTSLLLDILFSEGTSFYQELYEDRVVTEPIKMDFSIEKEFAFSSIGGDTQDPTELVSRIKSYLEKKKEEEISETEFLRSKKKMIGGFLSSLNSIEYIANSFTRYRFNDTDLFKIVPVLENISLAQINLRLKEHFDFEHMAVSIVSQP